MEKAMTIRIRLARMGLLLPLLLTACDRWTFEVLPEEALNCPSTRTAICKNLTFTSAVPEFSTLETGRQDVPLGVILQPGHYVLQVLNDTPPYSNHWIEWDYLALKAGDGFLWQIGQAETPPDLNYTGTATDEFCQTADCPTRFEVAAGKIDERLFPKTLNDGSVPGITIGFDVPPEQISTDLILTLSTLYSSHVPDTRDFKMRVILEGPF